MPRPKHDRHIEETPKATYFKPQGVPLICLEETRLSVEGLEAVRLSDVEGLTQAGAAARMRISRHTFGRVLAEARRAIAEALVSGRALRIEGGNWVFHGRPPPDPCQAAARKRDE